MSDCTDYRRRLLADPHGLDAHVRTHAATCPACAEYTERVQRFEDRLARAVRVGVKARTDNVIPLRPKTTASATRRTARRWAALAASVLVAAVAAGGLWVAAPGRSLAAAVVDHMGGEPDAWIRTDQAVPSAKLEAVLRDAHMRLKARPGLVSYANACTFRGHLVPHLVVQTDRGPVTVMLLTHEFVRSTVSFNEQGYRGVIEPMPRHGSLAVLERGTAPSSAALEEVAAHVAAAVEWLP